MRRFFKASQTRCFRAITSLQMLAWLLGVAAGAMLLAWCFQWSARFGTSLPVITAIALSVLLGLEWGWRSLHSEASEQRPKWTALGCQAFVLCWTLGFPWIVDWQSRLVALVPSMPMIMPGVAVAVLFGMGLLIFTPAVYALCRLPFCVVKKAEVEGIPIPPATVISLFVVGSGMGILASAFLLAPTIGLAKATIACSAMGLVAVAAWLARPSTAAGFSREQSTEQAAESSAPSFWDKQGRDVWTALVMICLGGIFAWMSRAVDQLLPTAVTLSATKWSCLLLGWAAGLFWGCRRSKKDVSPVPGTVTSFFPGAWLVLTAAGFPWLVDYCLNLSASVSQVFVLTTARIALVLVMVGPLGFAWGIFSAGAYRSELSKISSNKDTGTIPAVPLLAAVFLAGWLLGRWVLLPNGSMTALVAGFASVVLTLSLVRLFCERTQPFGWTSRAAMAGLSLLLLTSFLGAGNYQPQTSAELLFAAPVFTSKQAGLDNDLLTALDEGRHLTTVEGQRGTYTLWKYRGVQYQVRESGLPKGMASGKTEICPDFSAEVLPAALPLVLHERPESMLVLGLGSGVSVTTALAFPIQEVTCLETDPGLIKLVKDEIWSDHGADPAEDSRFNLFPIDPAIWLQTKTESFDIVVSLPHQATMAQNTPYFTKEFYRQAAGKLTEDGLFCQRFACIDFGPEALRVAAQTMQSVFGDVVFLEMAGGEMLLIGTNSSKGVSRDGFLDRLQKNHVRRQLARLGWDWSIPLNLTAFDHDAMKTFSTENQSWPAGANTASNGTLAFRLPAEMMRWGPKPTETQTALAEHSERFAEWGGIDPRDPDLLRRLAEVTGQRKLMTSNPDEYWAYRKAVKDQITKRPRSIIVQAKGEMPRKEIHPDEKRRLAYFRALGDTLKHHPHRAEDIAKVESFSEPYDPLVTYFLHHEAAELHSRAAERNYAAELEHRMHTVYFAAPGDRSVRSLTAALRILSDHPEAVSSVVERWDYLNALLQMLKQRWAMRAGVTPESSQVTINDVDHSLSAVHRAVKTMAKIREDAGIAPEEWKARRRFLETTVVHPLRAYRRQLLPFHQREKKLKGKLRAKQQAAQQGETSESENSESEDEG